MILVAGGLWFLTGIIVGWLANRWTPTDSIFGTFAYVTAGITGAVGAAWVILALFGESKPGILFWSILGALGGAILLAGLLFLITSSDKDRL